MEARVKATGEIVEVKIIDHPCTDEMYVEKFGEMSGRVFHITELDFDNLDYPDYWTRLEHQYAGMAMQGLLNNNLLSSVLFKTGTTHVDYINEVIKVAEEYAHALVEKMKEVK